MTKEKVTAYFLRFFFIGFECNRVLPGPLKLLKLMVKLF